MRILTPFDFADLFPEGKRLIFVGNAPSLQGEALGDWIDSHDIVVRFNHCPTEGYEADVGQKTDILIANPYPEGKAKPLFRNSNTSAIVILAPQTRRGDIQDFKKWVGDHNVLFSYSPDIVNVGRIDHRESLTTGTYGLHLISRLCLPSHISVTGFTMFLQDTAFHYWRNETPKGLHAHDIKQEAKIFVRICNSFRCSLEITSDIAWVARRSRTSLKQTTVVRKLKNPKWIKDENWSFWNF